MDSAGNLYIADTTNARVRKVDAAGIITTVAGNGQQADSGDGGPATSAALCVPTSVAFDGADNMFIGSGACGTVRMVNKAGIISTVAGSGKPGFSGDGGQATSATMEAPFVVAADSQGNFYIADEAIGTRIRKVNTAGIISTIAGNGTQGFSGDGGPATSAKLFEVHGLAVDGSGNVYINDYANGRIRKVDTSGIITTVAGGGSRVPVTGIPATSAGIAPWDVAVDRSGNIYIAAASGGLVKVTAAAGAPPTISANGVFNAAGYQPGIVANSWVSIQGTNLASKVDDWSNSVIDGKLPTSLDGVSVTMGGKPAYVYFVSPSQINVLAPDLPPGPTTVTVATSAGASSTFPTTVSQYAPAFFPWPGNQVVATRSDYSYAAKPGTFPTLTTTAAKPGDIIILWGTGFGPTTPPTPIGVAVPTGTTYSTATLPAVTINKAPVTVYGAALAPGSAGLYQIAIQVPNTLADGDWAIQATIGGVQSPAGTVLTVRQ